MTYDLGKVVVQKSDDSQPTLVIVPFLALPRVFISSCQATSFLGVNAHNKAARPKTAARTPPAGTAALAAAAPVFVALAPDAEADMV